MAEPWPAEAPGVLTLPDGRRVRGRGLRAGLPPGPAPAFGLYLLGTAPPPTDWPQRWVRWPDFRLPTDPDAALAALAALRDAYARAATERVEVACGGGTGRTGTALAALAVMSGVAPVDAVAFVRAGYRRRAVETPGQRRWVRRLPAG